MVVDDALLILIWEAVVRRDHNGSAPVETKAFAPVTDRSRLVGAHVETAYGAELTLVVENVGIVGMGN